jgi:hypothetical protein
MSSFLVIAGLDPGIHGSCETAQCRVVIGVPPTLAAASPLGRATNLAQRAGPPPASPLRLDTG